MLLTPFQKQLSDLKPRILHLISDFDFCAPLPAIPSSFDENGGNELNFFIWSNHWNNGFWFFQRYVYYVLLLFIVCNKEKSRPSYS